MNEDAYAEWLVKRKDPVYAVPVKILMIVLCLISIMSALQTVLGVIFMTLVGAATYFVFINLSVEFEYLVVEGDVSVDRILARSRRKKVINCKKEEIQIVAPSDSYMLKDYEKNGMKVKDCSSGRQDAKTYSLICQQGAECIKVIFEPNDKILRSLRYSIPGKLVK